MRKITRNKIIGAFLSDYLTIRSKFISKKHHKSQNHFLRAISNSMQAISHFATLKTWQWAVDPDPHSFSPLYPDPDVKIPHRISGIRLSDTTDIRPAGYTVHPYIYCRHYHVFLAYNILANLFLKWQSSLSFWKLSNIPSFFRK